MLSVCFYIPAEHGSGCHARPNMAVAAMSVGPPGPRLYMYRRGPAWSGWRMVVDSESTTIRTGHTPAVPDPDSAKAEAPPQPGGCSVLGLKQIVDFGSKWSYSS